MSKLEKQESFIVSFRLPAMAIKAIHTQLQPEQSINQFCQQWILASLNLSDFEASLSRSSFEKMLEELVEVEVQHRMTTHFLPVINGLADKIQELESKQLVNSQVDTESKQLVDTAVDTQVDTAVDNQPEFVDTAVDNQPEFVDTAVDNQPEFVDTAVDNQPEFVDTTLETTQKRKRGRPPKPKP